MRILALSSSTPRGGVALLNGDPQGDRLLAAAAYGDLRGHAERIFGAIDEVLAAADVARSAVQALGCDIGPGSFTGVRVAVASAKGIALALGIPIAGVSSLEAMSAAAFAEGAARPGDLVVPVIDAKKSELFLAAFDAPCAPPCAPPQHLACEEVAAAIEALAAGRRVVVVGEAALSIEPLRPCLARGHALDLPDAAWIGRVALGRLRASGSRSAEGELDAALLEPLYVRAPDAKPAELGYAPPR